MSMQIKVQHVGETKTGRYGPYGWIKTETDEYLVNGDPSQYGGKILEVEIATKNGQRGPYKVAKVLKVLESNGSANGNAGRKMEWLDYTSFLRNAHVIATELEPDTTHSPTGEDNGSKVMIDRSATRAQLIAMIVNSLSRGDFVYTTFYDDGPF